MKLIDVKIEDINKQKHRRYLPQRTGPAEYGVFDTYNNTYVSSGFQTGNEAQEFICTTDEESLQKQLAETQAKVDAGQVSTIQDLRKLGKADGEAIGSHLPMNKIGANRFRLR